MRIVYFLIKYDKLAISNKYLTHIADKVARDFQIMLGKNTIPILLEDIEIKDNNHDNDSFDYDDDYDNDE